MSFDRRNRKKVYDERRHAKKRAGERFGINLNRIQYADIVRQIQENRSIFIEKQSARISVHVIDLLGTKAFAVYDRHRNAVVTFLDVYGAENITPQQAIERTFKGKQRIPASW